MNVLVAGEAHSSIAPFLGGAPLYALKKDNDGVRPIAVGETLRRLVGKCCTQDTSIREMSQTILEPRQVGVGTRGGAEATVRAVNAVVAEHGHDDSLALLKVDFETHSIP